MLVAVTSARADRLPGHAPGCIPPQSDARRESEKRAKAERAAKGTALARRDARVRERRASTNDKEVPMKSVFHRGVAGAVSAIYLAALSACAADVSSEPEAGDILAAVPLDAQPAPVPDAGPPHGGDGGTVCTEDTCYDCTATPSLDAGPVDQPTEPTEPTQPDEGTEVAFRYNVWDLNDPNSRWPGCGSCGANNSYIACASNCCACNLGAAGGIAAIAVAWPTIAALGGLITEAGLAAFGALTTAEVASGIAALGVAAAAFKPWANACLKCYCNVEMKFD